MLSRKSSPTQLFIICSTFIIGRLEKTTYTVYTGIKVFVRRWPRKRDIGEEVLWHITHRPPQPPRNIHFKWIKVENNRSITKFSFIHSFARSLWKKNGKREQYMCRHIDIVHLQRWIRIYEWYSMWQEYILRCVKCKWTGDKIDKKRETISQRQRTTVVGTK